MFSLTSTNSSSDASLSSLGWPGLGTSATSKMSLSLKVSILVKDININSLTKIIGHHIVPVESFDTVVEKEILDNVIENESETLVVKDLLNKHYVGDEQLKMTVAKPNRFGCAREFFSTLPSQKDLLQYACFLLYFSFGKKETGHHDLYTKNTKICSKSQDIIF